MNILKLVLDHHGAGLEGVIPTKPLVPIDAMFTRCTLWVSVVLAIKMCIEATVNQFIR